jgi:predicted nucleic acid-binding protein
MILVDTSIIVAWLDKSHGHHNACQQALDLWASRDDFGISCVTYAELAAGARTKEGLDEQLAIFERVELDFEAAWIAGQRFRRYRPGRNDQPVLPDFFIRGQAVALGARHLTNDRGRIAHWPDLDFLFP